MQAQNGRLEGDMLDAHIPASSGGHILNEETVIEMHKNRHVSL